MAKCAVCDVRTGKRYCLAMGEDICPQCCGAEREVTLNCPFECRYLRESRRHEKRDLREADMPHRDVRIDAEFLEKADIVLMLMAAFFNKAVLVAPNAMDADAREALDALVASYRAAVAGETLAPVAEGAVAAGIVERFQDRMAAFITDLQNREGGVFADRALLGVTVFMARVAAGYNNGRPRCRAYVHYLRETFPEGPGAEPEPEAAA